MLKPIQDYVLVKLRDTGLFTGDKKLGDYVNGVVVAVGGDVPATGDIKVADLIGKRIYWQQYSEGAVLERDNGKYTLVKYENIMGVDDATNN